jgi:hypothetical protein
LKPKPPSKVEDLPVHLNVGSDREGQEAEGPARRTANAMGRPEEDAAQESDDEIVTGAATIEPPDPRAPNRSEVQDVQGLF